MKYSENWIRRTQKNQEIWGVSDVKRVIELHDEEIEKLSIISERRFYAFEWLTTDEEWDEVDLVC